MMYSIHFRPRATTDIKSVYDHIEYELFSPISAQRFIEGLYAKIDRLKYSADAFAISTYKDVLKYDADARHVTYKGFAIIYSIYDDLVLIHRVIHGSHIKG